MADSTASHANAIRRYVKSQNSGGGISKSAKNVSGSRSKLGRIAGAKKVGGKKVKSFAKVFKKTAKKTRGKGTITARALRRLAG